jgi:gliding motility-associated-like protein
MKKLLPVLILFCLIAPFVSVNAQIDEVSADYQIDNLSSFSVTFRSYYQSGAGSPVHFTMQDTLNYRFEWDFGDGMTGNLPVIMHSYPMAGTYNVVITVTDLSNPLLSFTGNIQVTVSDTFEVPNVFTPDGDGYNDSFIVRSNGVTPLNITIFDRSGSIVYKHSSPVINWDGKTPAGLRVRPGVYYYVITSSEPEYNKNGFVHIFYGN